MSTRWYGCYGAMIALMLLSIWSVCDGAERSEHGRGTEHWKIGIALGADCWISAEIVSGSINFYCPAGNYGSQSAPRYADAGPGPDAENYRVKVFERAYDWTSADNRRRSFDMNQRRYARNAC